MTDEIRFALLEARNCTEGRKCNEQDTLRAMLAQATLTDAEVCLSSFLYVSFHGDIDENI